MEDRIQIRGQKELQETVLNMDLCTGCGACVGICPYQTAYNDHTIILHPCDIEFGRCYAFCPRTPTDFDALRLALFDEMDLVPEIGAVKGFYVTRATDEQVRKNAQHGGTVTALMALAMEEGIIDTGIVAEDQENFLPHGVMAKDPTDIKKRGKSKFIVSPTIAEFNRTARNESNKIGVVATPCQALALAKMRIKPIAPDDNNIDKLRLVIGLFCGWALSWRNLLDLLGKKTDIDAIIGMDIPPSNYKSIEVYTKKGTIKISLDDINPCIREACLYCFDMTAEFSDISVGSARLPEGWEVARSWNHVLVRTQIGHELMELAKSRGILEFRDVPKENLDRLKMASMNKKRKAVKNLAQKSGSSDNLLYLDSRDTVLRTLFD
jgi:coenzyme F420 hydrogenase subunit beta